MCRLIPDDLLGHVPIECLRSVEQTVGKLPVAMGDEDERSALLCLCSYSCTESPSGAAACMRQVAGKLSLADAVAMCRQEKRYKAL